jgi:hypothetical protein
MGNLVDWLISIQIWVDGHPGGLMLLALWTLFLAIHSSLVAFKGGPEVWARHEPLQWLRFIPGLALFGTLLMWMLALTPRAVLEQFRLRVKPAAAYPARWRSLDDGSSMTLLFAPDRIHVERLAGPKAQPAEIWKRGEGYTGKLPAPCMPAGGRNPAANRECAEAVPIEITSVTAARITGRMQTCPGGAPFDCATCSCPAEPVWRPFVWIPE